MAATPPTKASSAAEPLTASPPAFEQRPRCGIVMPISAIDGCSESHWSEVKAILEDAVRDAGFEPNLVSDGVDAGVIQKRIVQNLHQNELILCDVSARNPNVMLELGMRLAFDRPVVLVKDDVTPFSFDTHDIEHIQYRRDLRFPAVAAFKDRLRKKLAATAEEVRAGRHTTYLKHFGGFEIARIESREVPEIALIRSELSEVRRLLSQGPILRPEPAYSSSFKAGDLEVSIDGCTSAADCQEVMNTISAQSGVLRVDIAKRTDSMTRFDVWLETVASRHDVGWSIQSAIDHDMPQFASRFRLSY